MSADGHRSKWRRNIAENFNRLSGTRTLQTDGRAMTYSTFAKTEGFYINKSNSILYIFYRKLLIAFVMEANALSYYIGAVRYRWWCTL